MTKLFLVPTPIGNLEDITLRAISVLSEVDLILAEDTRKTRFLLKHLAIEKKIISHHKFNEHKTLDHILARMKAGETMALVSDAGTPSISDPGFLLVRACIEHNIRIECLPGPTAFVPAIVASGLASERFCFEGFLPVKKGRQKRLQKLKEEDRTMVFYESPHRILKLLSQLVEVLGSERNASVSRELTKMHEETVRGSLNQLTEYFSTKTPRGEFVLVVAGKKEAKEARD